MASTKPESSPKPSTNTQAYIELSMAGILWGFGFVATVWALKFLSPSAVLFYRFSIAFIIGMIFLLIRRTSYQTLKSEFKLALIPGVLLWFSLIFQTWGLQHTTATNATFITTLYVVMVPLVRALTKEERLHWIHWFCVGLALLGTGFIVEVQKLTELNWGDLLTFACAIFAAVHILSVGQKALQTQNSFAFNTFQSLWMGLFSLIIFPFSTTRWNLAVLDHKAWIGILSLGLGASMIAFYLQIRSQKKLSPSVASLLFLLESPASCFFAYWFLDEKMHVWQWTGAGMILIACGLISLLKRQAEHAI